MKATFHKRNITNILQSDRKSDRRTVFCLLVKEYFGPHFIESKYDGPTFREGSITETDPKLHGTNNGSDWRPPSISSLPQSSHRDVGRRKLGMRTPSIGEISQTNIAPGEPHAQDGSEVGDRRPPSNPSLPLSLSRGGERRWSNGRPPNSDVLPPSSFDAGGPSTRGINEGREDHPNRRPRDVHGAVAGHMPVHHHKSSLLKNSRFPPRLGPGLTYARTNRTFDWLIDHKLQDICK
jgi:hypothetical protein